MKQATVNQEKVLCGLIGNMFLRQATRVGCHPKAKQIRPWRGDNFRVFLPASGSVSVRFMVSREYRDC